MEEKRKAPVGGSADVSRRMSSANEPRPLPSQRKMNRRARAFVIEGAK